VPFAVTIEFYTDVRQGFDSPSSRPVVKVDASFGGNISAALAHAATLSDGAIVELGAHAYTLNFSLVLPNNTLLRGAGETDTHLVFGFNSEGAAASNSFVQPFRQQLSFALAYTFENRAIF
jgi:hypothetical protein